MIRKNKAEDQYNERMTKKREMEEQLRVMDQTDWSGIMMICIHGQAENRIYGTIVNRCLSSPLPFCGLDQLILKIDEVCELAGKPMLSMYPRFLQAEMREQYAELSKRGKKNGQKKQEGWQEMSDIIKRQEAVTKEVMEIQILFRGNATMQGRLRCQLSSKKYVSFRSALELFRMLKEVEVRFCENSRLHEADSGFTDVKRKDEKRGKAI